MARTWLLIALAAVASTVAVTEAATNHVVGGSTGWTIPSSASLYSQWASGETFTVGDTLSFNFTTGIHNVIEVPKSSYDACSAKSQIGSALTTGPATVTVTAPGNHYYICGVTGHCSIGQKLAISVTPKGSSSSPAPAPAAKASPSGPAPAPVLKTGSPAPPAAPSSGAGLGTAPSSGLAPAPATGGPAPATAPSSSASAGTSTAPSASSPSDNQTPSEAARPSGSGPSTSSAPSSSHLTSVATAALLSATAAFLL